MPKFLIETSIISKARYFTFKAMLTLLNIILVSCNSLQNISHEELIDHRTTEKLNVNVALLLPFQSTSENTNLIARHLLNSAVLGVSKSRSQINITTYPTEGKKTLAAQAAETAVEMGNEIILGPLFSDETTAVKNQLANKDIKIISFSNDPSVAGDNVFILGTTFDSIANRLINYAVSKKYTRLAIIAPMTEVGTAGLNSVKKSIEKNGGFLTLVSRYPLSVNGINDAAPTIFSQLVNSSTEAIVFTDTPNLGLGFISERIHTLYENSEYDLPKFLGISRWDQSKQALEEYSLNNGWFVLPSRTKHKQFVKTYVDRYGIYPPELSSIAYDAIIMTDLLVQESLKSPTSTRFDFKNVTNKIGFDGVNGIFRLNNSGTADRYFNIGEVQAGKVKIIDAKINLPQGLN